MFLSETKQWLSMIDNQGTWKKISYWNLKCSITPDQMNLLNEKWRSVKFTQYNLQVLQDEIHMLTNKNNNFCWIMTDTDAYWLQTCDINSKRWREINVDEIIRDNIEERKEQLRKEWYLEEILEAVIEIEDNSAIAKQQEEDKKVFNSIEDDFKLEYSDNKFSLYTKACYVYAMEQNLWESLLFTIMSSKEYADKMYWVKIWDKTLEEWWYDVINKNIWNFNNRMNVSEWNSFLVSEWWSFSWIFEKRIQWLIWTKRPTEENPIILDLEWTNKSIIVFYDNWVLYTWPYIS